MKTLHQVMGIAALPTASSGAATGGQVMKKIGLFAIGACMLWSGTAAAADMAVKAYPTKPCCEAWWGFYFGAYFGSGAGNASHNGTDTQRQTFIQTVPGTTVTQVFTDNGTFSGKGKTDGSVVDLFVGYNARWGESVVVGGQIEGTVFSDIVMKSSGTRNSIQNQTTTTVAGGITTVTTANATAADTFDVNDQLRSIVSFTGRAGWLSDPSLLWYVLGGGVAGHFVIPGNDDPRGGDRGLWRFGYTVGAGVEKKLNKNWSLRAEYRYLHFNVHRDVSSFDTQTQVTGATTFSNNNSFSRGYTQNVDFHVGKIGIVYAFCACD